MTAVGGAAISLVVPVRDEAASLPLLLDSIARQSRRPDEVLLVDGGSTDGTPAIARRFAADDPSYRIIEAGAATPGRGRNIGIEAARHEWIALTDAGIELDADWLRHLEAAALARPEAEVVWGTYEPRVGSFLDSCASVAYVPAPRPTPDGYLRGPSVASCLLRRQAWQQVAGFPDLRAAEDLVFIERIERAGIESTAAPDAVVTWSLPASIGDTFRRFRSYSAENVLAGRQKDWHRGVARLYLVAAVIGVGALLVDGRLFALVAAGGAARVARSLRDHRHGHSVLWLLNPLRFAGVAVMLGVTDAATFAGWADALLHARRVARPLSSSPPRPTISSGVMP